MAHMIWVKNSDTNTVDDSCYRPHLLRLRILDMDYESWYLSQLSYLSYVGLFDKEERWSTRYFVASRLNGTDENLVLSTPPGFVRSCHLTPTPPCPIRILLSTMIEQDEIVGHRFPAATLVKAYQTVQSLMASGPSILPSNDVHRTSSRPTSYTAC